MCGPPMLQGRNRDVSITLNHLCARAPDTGVPGLIVDDQSRFAVEPDHPASVPIAFAG